MNEKIGDRIKKLRIMRGLTQKDIATLLDVSPSAIGMYEQNRREPDANTLIKISEQFNVSTDYLLGNSKENESFGTSLISTFGKLIKQEREQKGITIEQMACNIGMSPSLLMNIESKGAKLSLDAAIKIANYLEVSTDYLLGREEKEKPATYDELLSDPQNREFIELYSKLTPEERKMILAAIRGMLSKN